MLATLLLAFFGAAAASACTTDADCGLLGDCLQGVCRCDPGWTGATCASLDLAPAPVDSGLRQQNSSNWCGTLLRDATDPDLYHSYNSDFGGCRNGLGIWLTGSRVIHSTGRSPVGPFVPRWSDGAAEVAVSGEAHNPQAIQAPDGTYLLFDSYGGPDAGCPLEANYTTCRGVGSACKPKMPSGGGAGLYTFHSSASPAGPWSPVTVSMDFPCYSENLTPSPFFHVRRGSLAPSRAQWPLTLIPHPYSSHCHFPSSLLLSPHQPNGTLFLVLHCDKDATHNMCDLVMVRSVGTAWRGPFQRVNDRVWDSTGVAPHPEDPFFFIRTSPTTQQLSYHIILHNEPRGIHLFSESGFTFTLQQALVAQRPQAPFVFSEVVTQEDGSNFTAGRRERPWLLFEPGTTRPQALLTSMQAPAWPVVFSHAQLVR